MGFELTTSQIQVSSHETRSPVPKPGPLNSVAQTCPLCQTCGQSFIFSANENYNASIVQYLINFPVSTTLTLYFTMAREIGKNKSKQTNNEWTTTSTTEAVWPDWAIFKVSYKSGPKVWRLFGLFGKTSLFKLKKLLFTLFGSIGQLFILISGHTGQKTTRDRCRGAKSSIRSSISSSRGLLKERATKTGLNRVRRCCRRRRQLMCVFNSNKMLIKCFLLKRPDSLLGS